MEKIGYVWHGVETIGTVGLGAGMSLTGVLGWGAACFSGNPLLCVAVSEAAPAFILGGYYMTKASLKELQEPNNPDFGAACQ
jgi:hypothetical protein